MELCENVFCRLCHNSIDDNNCTVIDEAIAKILNVLLLKLDLKPPAFSVICNACYVKVSEAFRFKITCMHTEDIIFPYLNFEDGAAIDLREVYLKDKGKKHVKHISGDESRVCRLCMQIYTHGFTPVIYLENDLTSNYIPEMNFNSTKEPVICSSCLNSLHTHGRFLKNCSGVLDKTNIAEDTETFYIKTEEIEIKSEEDDNGYAPDCVESYAGQTGQSHEEIYNNLARHDQPTPIDSPEEQMYKCDTCNYETKYKNNFNRHQLKHENISKVEMFTCCLCNFKTKYKDGLTRHRLIHKDRSKVQMYKCDTCTFETKYKKYIVQHQLVHKDKSEVQMYKCDTCDYETKYKSYVVQHQLVHKDISKVQMYKCESCNYQSRYKKYLINHQLIHKDIFEVQMYKCDKCTFQTKYNISLVQHQLVHKDTSQVQMYKCDKCNFETKRKRNLVRHQLTQRHLRDANVQEQYIQL